MLNKRNQSRHVLSEPRIIIDGKIAGFLENISIDGAGLVLNNPYKEGDTFSFTIDFGRVIFSNSIRVAKARVNWISQKHYYDLNKMGIYFEVIEDEELKKLKNFLNFWERDDAEIIQYINELEKVVKNPEILSRVEIENIIAQFSFLRVIPLAKELPDLIKNLNLSKKLLKGLEQIQKMSSAELLEMENTIQAFENTSNMTKAEIIEREEVIDAYEKLQDYMRHELLEKDQMLEATQKVIEIANQEKKEKDKVIAALEKIEEMMRKDQIARDEVIQAHEQLHKMYRNELVEKETLIHAFEELQNLYGKEMKEKDKILRMHNILENLAKQEIIEKDKELEMRELLSELSREEILQREKVIQAYDQFTETMKEEIIQKDKMIERIKKTEKDIDK